MKVAYFDCQFGAAGDMLCASLLANGLDFNAWNEELKKIAVPPGSFEVTVEDVMRCLISSKKVNVKCLNYSYKTAHNHEPHEQHSHDHAHSHSHDHEHAQGGHEHSEHAHSHEHDHAHKHSHDHEHSHDRDHAHPHDHSHLSDALDASDALDVHHHEGASGRSIKQILDIIDQSAISPRAKALSSAIFKNLAEAESKVHHVSPESVHFHEVGAIDAIVDIIGFSIGFDLLGIEKTIVSPLTMGGGTIRTEHGLYPIPAPATINLVERAKAPTSSTDIKFECLTPTGAAILTTIADAWGAPPAFEKIDSVGYGAGTMNPKTHPNAVRMYIGHLSELKSPSVNSQSRNHEVITHMEELSEQFRSEVVAVIEANIDDCPPNIIAYTLEKALAEGALDISVVPATMKKGRSGHLLTVLAKPEDKRRLEILILKETSTLGVRSYFVERLVAEREYSEVKLSDAWSIRVKIGRDLNGNIVNVQPEYADCATYAERHGLPLKDVFEKALSTYLLSKRD